MGEERKTEDKTKETQKKKPKSIFDDVVEIIDNLLYSIGD